MARSEPSPPARRIEGVAVVDLTGDFNDPRLPYHYQMFLSLIVAALQHRAREVIFDPWDYEEVDEHGYRRGVRVGFRAGGDLEEFVPPPRWIATPLLREIGRISGISTWRGRLAYRLRRLASWIDDRAETPRLGRFRLGLGDVTLDVRAVAWPARSGHWITLTLPPTNEDTVRRAEAIIAKNCREHDHSTDSIDP